MFLQLVFLSLPLAIFSSTNSREDCNCPPVPVCPPPSAPCSTEAVDITDKRIIEKIQSGKLKMKKQTGIEEPPAVHVEGETESHVHKRSPSQDFLIPDDDSDLIQSKRQNSHRFNRKAKKQASFANALEDNSQSAVLNAVSSDPDAAVDIKCNSQVLKKLMLENIGDNSSVSKRAISDRAEAKFGGSIDVICSKGHFSYVYSSNLYCEATKGEITCIAFRQSH